MNHFRIQRRLNKSLFYKSVVAAEQAAITQMQQTVLAIQSPIKRAGDPLLNLENKDRGRLKLSDRFDESLFNDLARNAEKEEDSSIDNMSYEQFDQLMKKYDKSGFSKTTKSIVNNFDDDSRKAIFALFRKRKTILQLRSTLNDPTYRKALEQKITKTNKDASAYYHEMALLYNDLFEHIHKYNKELQTFLRHNAVSTIDFNKNNIAAIIARKEYEAEKLKLNKYRIAIQKNAKLPLKDPSMIKALKDNNADQVPDYDAAKRYIENELHNQGINIQSISLSELPVDIVNKIQAYKNLVVNPSSNASAQDAQMLHANALADSTIKKWNMLDSMTTLNQQSGNDSADRIFDDLQSLNEAGTPSAEDFEELAIDYLTILFPDGKYIPTNLIEKMQDDLTALYNAYKDAGAFEEDINSEKEEPEEKEVFDLFSSIRSFFAESLAEKSNNFLKDKKLKDLIDQGNTLRKSLMDKFGISGEVFQLINDPRGHYFKSQEMSLFLHLAETALAKVPKKSVGVFKRLQIRMFKQQSEETLQKKELAYSLLQYAELVRKYFSTKQMSPDKITEINISAKLEKFMESVQHNSLEKSLKNIRHTNDNLRPIYFKSYYLDFSLSSIDDVEDKLEEINEFLDQNKEGFQRFLRDKSFQNEIVKNQEDITEAAFSSLQVAEFQNVLSELKPTKEEVNNYKYVQSVTDTKAQNRNPALNPISTQAPTSKDAVVLQDMRDGTMNGAFKYHQYLLNYKPTELTQTDIDFGLVQKDFTVLRRMIGEHLAEKRDTLQKNLEITLKDVDNIKIDEYNSVEDLRKQEKTNGIIIDDYRKSLQVIKENIVGGFYEITLPKPGSPLSEAIPAVGLKNGLRRHDKKEQVSETPYFTVELYDYLTETPETNVTAHLLQFGSNIHELLAEDREFAIDSDGNKFYSGERIEAQFKPDPKIYILKVLNIRNNIINAIHVDSNLKFKITQNQITSDQVPVHKFPKGMFKSGTQQNEIPKEEPQLDVVWPPNKEDIDNLDNDLKLNGFISADLANMSIDQKRFLIKRQINKEQYLNLVNAGHSGDFENLPMADFNRLVKGLEVDPPKTEEELKTASVPFMITQVMRKQLNGLGYSPEAVSHMTPEQAHEIINNMKQAPEEAPAAPTNDDIFKEAAEELNKPKTSARLSITQMSILNLLGYNIPAIDNMSFETAEEIIRAKGHTVTPVTKIEEALIKLGYDPEKDIFDMSISRQNKIVEKGITKDQSVYDETQDPDLAKRVIAYKRLATDIARSLLNKNQAIALYYTIGRLLGQLLSNHKKLKKTIEDSLKSAETYKKQTQEWYNNNKTIYDAYDRVKAAIEKSDTPDFKDLDILKLEHNKEHYSLIIENLAPQDRSAYYNSLLNRFALSYYRTSFESRKSLYDSATVDRATKTMNTYFGFFKDEVRNLNKVVQNKIQQENKLQEDLRKGLGDDSALTDIVKLKTLEDFSPDPEVPADITPINEVLQINEPDDNPDYHLSGPFNTVEPLPLPSLDDAEEAEPKQEDNESEPSEIEEENEEDVFNPANLFQEKIIETDDIPENEEDEQAGTEDKEVADNNEYEHEKSNLGENEEPEDLEPILKYIRDHE